ncbi:MAG TPA: hypothetical protein VF791_01330 [Pyrinomonadaceae bacterium]
MKNLLLYTAIAVFTLYPPSAAGQNYEERGAPKTEASQSSHSRLRERRPNFGGLNLISQPPAGIPPRISGLAYDGERFWAVIYQGRGRYAIFDPLTLEWRLSDKNERHKVIREVSGLFGSPGGICFVGDRLWVAGSYGESFGSINMQDWKVERLFKGRQRADQQATQSYFGMTYDGSYLWIAWHWFKYKLPESQTQLLLKIDPTTGKVIAEYPLPAGTRNDGTHSLVWDGERLWHMKDNRLSVIDPSNGVVTAQYTLDPIKRPSGLAWDEKALWIVEFDGKIWRLPFEDMRDSEETTEH